MNNFILEANSCSVCFRRPTFAVDKTLGKSKAVHSGRHPHPHDLPFPTHHSISGLLSKKNKLIE